MATQNIYNLTDTWNDGATTFNAIKMNVTDAASSSSSLLINLQHNGGDKLRIFKDGLLNINNTTAFVTAGPSHTSAIHFGSSNVNEVPVSIQYNYGIALKSTSKVAWGSTAVNTTSDVALARDSAGVLKITDGSTGNGTLKIGDLELGLDGNSKPSVYSTIGHIVFRTGQFVSEVNINQAGLHIGTSDGIISFNGGYGATVTGDVAFARDSAGVLKITDGSTGYGHLVVDTVRINNPINTQTGVLFTPAVSDAERYIRLNNSAAITVSVPSDATANIPVGSTITFEQTGTGTVTFVAGSGATVNSRDGLSSTVGQYSVASLIKTAANTFTLTGDLV